MKTKPIKARLKKISGLKLDTGAHKSLEDGACIMEMVAYVANEPWSDHPKCACPILTEYAIRLNDRFNDEHRQELKPFIEKLVGTRSTDEVQIKRKRLLRWRNVTATYPLLLDLFKMPELADRLRALGNNLEDMAKAKEILSENREAIRAYADAYAYTYAYANAYADTYADAYAYADANAYVYANAYADAYTYAYTYANAYADTYADAYANADADAYANANAYVYVYANAYADANVLRPELVDVSIETMRMAIEVKE